MLYRITGSPTVLENGLWPLALVKRVKVFPPSVETDAPEMLIGAGVAAPRIIVSYNDLVGIIWVTCSGCLRLCNIAEMSRCR